MATIDEEVYWGMRPNQIYVSKAFPEYGGDLTSRILRYATKAIDSDTVDVCDVEARELVIRQTQGGRQQIKVLFFEDDRSVQRLIIQRFYANGTKPSKRQHFSFAGRELDRLLWMLQALRRAEFDDSEKIRFSDEYLEEMLSNDADLLRFVERHRERKRIRLVANCCTLFLSVHPCLWSLPCTYTLAKSQAGTAEGATVPAQSIPHNKNIWSIHCQYAYQQRMERRTLPCSAV